MDPNLFIKYRPTGSDDAGMQLSSLGKSLIGFEEVINEVFKISKISGEIDIKATKESSGSLVVEICIYVITHIPFEKAQDYLDFLRLADPAVYQTALQHFTESHRSLNDYFAKNPLDFTLVTGFITYLIGLARGQKRLTLDNNIPANYAKKLHALVKRGKFKKALKPFIENEVTEITISPKRTFAKQTKITIENFEDYLSENEKILPDLENGSHHTFTGKIVGLQTARGESMKFEVDGFKRSERLLVAFPPDGRTTADYTRFYDKVVQIDAEIVRRSLYQKPQLIICTIDFAQISILSEED